MSQQRSVQLRTVEQLVDIGFARSRVVLMNEAHNGWLRCVRTREIGRRVLPVAHAAGVRHLAMEALADPGFVEDANRNRSLPKIRGQSYLAQPEMRTFIQTALDLGWTLIGYEADMSLAPTDWDLMSDEFTTWREKQQAVNLVQALELLPSDTKILVWCGNGHLYKSHRPWPGSWEPMGWHFRDVSGIDPFAIDQVVTVDFGEPDLEKQAVALERYAPDLRILGGTVSALDWGLERAKRCAKRQTCRSRVSETAKVKRCRFSMNPRPGGSQALCGRATQKLKSEA